MINKEIKIEKGITLIALVVTIVILLILAGITLSIILGENGIITEAIKAADATNQAISDEQDFMDNVTDQMHEIISSVQSGSGSKTSIGYLYKKGTIKDGDVIGNYTKYVSSESSSKLSGTDWIVFGQDESGNVLLTTSKQIEVGFTTNLSAQAWLTYEDDLHSACSIYKPTSNIQGKTITARSITLEDINRVTNFIVPEAAKREIKFGTTEEMDAGTVDFDCYHPDETSTEVDGEGNKVYWSKNQKSYVNNAYLYYVEEGQAIYADLDLNEKAYYTASTLKNMNLVVGDSSDFGYVVASRSVAAITFPAYFCISIVISGTVASIDVENTAICISWTDGFYDDYGYSDELPVRPVIVLPSSIELTQTSGIWNIK